MSDLCKKLSDGAKGLKAGIADRAVWFHLLVEAAENAKDFVDLMTEPGPGREAFDQEVILAEDDHAVAHFHACPLVEAWKNYGLSDERVAYLCGLASKGDFGRASNFPQLAISFPKKIAHGDAVCELNVRRVK